MKTLRFGYHRLILPDGTLCGPSVVETDENGAYISHHPLQGEEPFVEWKGGTMDLTKQKSR